jgi:hypothetical protein
VIYALASYRGGGAFPFAGTSAGAFALSKEQCAIRNGCGRQSRFYLRRASSWHQLRSMSAHNLPHAAETGESLWRRLRTALEWPAIIASGLALPFLSGRAARGWDLLVLGLFFAHHVASDVERGLTLPPDGRTQVDPYGYPASAYVRSADPIGFWVLIALKGALAAAAVFIALGDLLGFWNLLG